GDLALGALGGRLVDEYARVRQGGTLARGAGGQQHGGGGGGLAEADGLDVRADVLHGVVDRHQRGEGATGAVDVHGDVAVGVKTLEDQQLRHDVVGGGVVDLGAQEDDALLEELGVRVGLLGAVGGLLDEGGQDVTR